MNPKEVGININTSNLSTVDLNFLLLLLPLLEITAHSINCLSSNTANSTFSGSQAFFLH